MECYLCGGQAVHKHHIVGGNGKRKACETKYSVIHLCLTCHNKVHSDYGLNKALRIELQDIYFEQGKTEAETRELMGGKLYV